VSYAHVPHCQLPILLDLSTHNTWTSWDSSTWGGGWWQRPPLVPDYSTYVNSIALSATNEGLQRD